MPRSCTIETSQKSTDCKSLHLELIVHNDQNAKMSSLSLQALLPPIPTTMMKMDECYRCQATAAADLRGSRAWSCKRLQPSWFQGHIEGSKQS